MQILIDLLLTMAVAVVGALFGWLLSGGRRSPAGRADGPADQEVTRAREALDQLHELATKVAFDVGQHHNRVEAINEELAASNAQDSESVTTAVAKLVAANHQLQQRLATAEVRLQEQAWLVESHAAQARTDALTGLNNRRAFDDALGEGLAKHRKAGTPLTVVMIDIDHFKKFNDTYGHQAGDEVLHRVGGILRETLSSLGFVARYGGEEFSVILPESRLETIGKALEAFRRAVERFQFRYDGITMRVTISAGAASLRSGEDTAALVRRADEALYVSKKAGRNCAHWHDGESILPLTPAAAPSAAESPAVGGAELGAASRPAPVAEDVPPAVASAEADDAEETADAAAPGEPRATRLRNRTAFCVSLGSQMADWRCGGPAPSVVLMRIDRLPQLRSQFGRDAVDDVIRSTSEALIAAVRRMDLLAYYDHGTFAVLLPGTVVARAATTAQRLRRIVTVGVTRAGAHPVQVTLSVGIAEAVDSDNLERILLRATEALSSAERRGGDCVSYHNGVQSEPAESLLHTSSAGETDPEPAAEPPASEAAASGAVS